MRTKCGNGDEGWMGVGGNWMGLWSDDEGLFLILSRSFTIDTLALTTTSITLCTAERRI